MGCVRYFLDTEFIEQRNVLELLSVALVAADGREYYAVNRHADWSRANEWVREHVLPGLCAEPSKSLYVIKEDILRFIGEDMPEFWGYYADYDWVVFCWIFGRMIDLPQGWPRYCRDIKQWSDRLGGIELPPQREAERHHALHDARWIKHAYGYLNRVERGVEGR